MKCSLRWCQPDQVQRVSISRIQSQLASLAPPHITYEVFILHYNTQYATVMKSLQINFMKRVKLGKKHYIGKSESY